MVYLARLRNRPPGQRCSHRVSAAGTRRRGGSRTTDLSSRDSDLSPVSTDAVAEITGPQGQSASAGVRTGQVQAWPRNEHLRYRGDPPARIGLGCPARETLPSRLSEPAGRQEGRKPGPAERPDRRRSAAAAVLLTLCRPGSPGRRCTVLSRRTPGQDPRRAARARQHQHPHPGPGHPPALGVPLPRRHRRPPTGWSAQIRRLLVLWPRTRARSHRVI
jgi:hypothetical protein